MTIRVNDKGLRAAFKAIENNEKINSADVKTLLKATEDGPGLSKTERSDLVRILERMSDKMEPAAKSLLKHFVSTEAVATAGGQPIPILSKDAADISDPKKLAKAFSNEIGERAAEFDTPEKAFQLFAEYGGKLKALIRGMDKKEADVLVSDLLEAGRNSKAKGYDTKDTDFDTMGDLEEAARGRHNATFDVRDEETGKVWTTTYWPMAGGGGGMDQPGTAGSNLWANEGPLAKLDGLLKARGMEDAAKALEFERKPALNWLIGEREKGHFIPNSSLSEKNAEATTGVDFDGDGKITKGVQVDFLGHDAGFAAIGNRNQLVPKATLGGEAVEVRRERITDDDGNISFKFFNKANDKELTADELKTVFYANPQSDGSVDGSMSVGWWGSCDKVALAGVLFKEPLKDNVTIDGVKFSKQDILGLLTVIADSQSVGTDFIGSRFDDKPDIVATKDGKQLSGKFVDLKDEDFRSGDGMWRWDGDFMVLTDAYANDSDKEFKFKEMNGTEHTIKASDIKHMAREDKKDISPVAFHTTMLDWLSDGRAAAMDRDSGDHVWNYNFHGATLKSGVELAKDARGDLKTGHNGKPGEDTKVVKYEMDVRFGESNWPRTYEYWLEFDANGKAINGGWESDNPDFLWRPAEFRGWTGANDRNPFVKPELVKEIYDKFMEN